MHLGKGRRSNCNKAFYGHPPPPRGGSVDEGPKDKYSPSSRRRLPLVVDLEGLYCSARRDNFPDVYTISVGNLSPINFDSLPCPRYSIFAPIYSQSTSMTECECRWQMETGEVPHPTDQRVIQLERGKLQGIGIDSSWR